MPVTGVPATAVDPVASLVAALDAATAATTASASALSSRQVIAGTGLTGGGTLAADRTFTVDFATSGVASSTQAVRADDTRLSQGVLRPGRTWLFAGDSITNGSSASNYVRSFSRQAVHMAGTLYAAADSIEGGTSGYTSAQLLAFMPTLLSTYAPNAVHIQIGTNDSGAGVTLATYQTNVQAIAALAKKANAVVTVGTVPPRSSNSATLAASRPLIAAYNLWLRLWAPGQGIELADTHTALVNTTSGDLLSTYDSGDGVHPNTLGHLQMAKVVSAAMLRAMGPNARPTQVLSALPANLVTNPLMVGAGSDPTGGGSLSSTGTAPTRSIVSDATGLLPAGRWAQIDLNAGATSTFYREFGVSASGWTVGDTLVLTGMVQIEVVSGDWEATYAADTAKVAMQIRDANTGVVKADAFDRCAGRIVTGTTYQIGPIWIPWTVPAGVTSIFIAYGVDLPNGVEVKAKFGVVGLFNATSLGVSVGAASMVNVDGP